MPGEGLSNICFKLRNIRDFSHPRSPTRDLRSRQRLFTKSARQHNQQKESDTSKRWFFTCLTTSNLKFCEKPSTSRDIQQCLLFRHTRLLRTTDFLNNLISTGSGKRSEGLGVGEDVLSPGTAQLWSQQCKLCNEQWKLQIGIAKTLGERETKKCRINVGMFKILQCLESLIWKDTNALPSSKKSCLKDDGKWTRKSWCRPVCQCSWVFTSMETIFHHCCNLCVIVRVWWRQVYLWTRWTRLMKYLETKVNCEPFVWTHSCN